MAVKALHDHKLQNKTTIDPYPSVTLNNLQMENKINSKRNIQFNAKIKLTSFG
jgi:hypothetical protein